MRRNEANEFSWRYYLGFLPEYRETFLISRNQIVRTSRIGRFEKHIVIGVAGHFKATGRSDDMAMLLNELQ
jgi:hypothetical protein